MFKFHYNILAALQVAFGLGNYFLLMKTFGVSPQTDAYLMGFAIMTSLQFLQMLLVEQYMYFYCEAKNAGDSNAHSFFCFGLTFSLLVGVLSSLLFEGFLPNVISLFAYGLDVYRLSLLSHILRILLISLAVYPVTYVLVKTMNAEMSFAFPYIVNIFPSSFVVLIQLYLLFVRHAGIAWLAYAYVVGVISAVFAAVIFLRYRKNIPFHVKFFHPLSRKFICNSLTMRFGHNIHNFLFSPITSNFLAILPSGDASCFYYAQKIALVLFSVIVGPSHSVFLSKVALAFSGKHNLDVLVLMRKFFRVTIMAFSLSVFAVYLGFPLASHFLAYLKITPKDFHQIKFLFLMLAIWQFIIVAEIPFVGVGMAAKDSAIFISTNALFILIYFLGCLAGFSRLGIYAIPTAAIVGQLLNFYFYTRHTCKLLVIPFRKVLV